MAGDLADRCRLNPLPVRFDTYVRCWSFEVSPGILADSTNIQLRSCDGCKHVCYADGRPCCEGHEEWSGNWFCRRCWSRWEPAAFMAFPPSLSAWALGAPSDGNVNPLVSAQGRKFKGLGAGASGYVARAPFCYTCVGDAYDPMTEVEDAVDKAVANIFGIFGEELGLRVGGSLAKNMSVRRALDELLARQESVFLDQQNCQWMDHQLQLASAKAGWLTRRRYLEQISIDEKAMRRSAEMELEATELRLAMAEKACRQLMQLRAEFIPSEVAPEAPSSPSAILLGNTHLRVPQDEAKKASETEEPSGEPTSPAADTSADPLPDESSGAPRNPQARLVTCCAREAQNQSTSQMTPKCRSRGIPPNKGTPWSPLRILKMAVLGDFTSPQMLEGISDWGGVQTWWPAPYSPYSENMMPDMTSSYPLPAQPFAAADWMTMPDAASCAGLAEGKYAVPKPFNLWQTSTDAFGQPGTQALRKAGGGIFQEAQLQDVPSTLPAGSGLALFADGTVPAREEASLTCGGRWLLGLPRNAEDFVPLLNEVWFALTSGLLRSHFEGHADVCGVAVSLTVADAKVALWLKHAEEELHVLAVGQVLLDMLLAVEEKVSGIGAADIRIKFEDFQRGRVTQKLRGA
ncbi:EIF4E1B [Symbiodinium necroappetens]|uniref:EIF4E1B protein n=1 Tax=Symbiodinium necroappetens TaxID=1628268 RepID=A0A812SHE8_9DINO|nr:EIF4E1B [Symbiodinium necroappetens]